MEPIYPAVVNPIVRGETRRYMSLDGQWSVNIDPEEHGARERWSEDKEPFELSLEVPGSIVMLKELAGDYPSFKQANNYSGDCWFQRQFDVGEEFLNAEQLWLKFGGVSPNAHIWLNGTYVGFHSQPIVAFKVDVTDALSAIFVNIWSRLPVSSPTSTILTTIRGKALLSPRGPAIDSPSRMLS